MANKNDEVQLGLLGGGGGESSGSGPQSLGQAKPMSCLEQAGLMVLDIVASVGFWYVLLFLRYTDNQFYCFMGGLAVLMIIYRLYLAYSAGPVGEISTEVVVPYTCGFVSTCGKEMFLVATIHISPRAPLDVEAVIEAARPDVAMIELDEERLDRMRDVEPAEAKPKGPRPEDLQPISVGQWTAGSRQTVLAQRALWNAERCGDTVSGSLVYESANEYGLAEYGERVRGNVVLVRRGAANGEYAPFALKAFKAARAGAVAVLVINQDDQLPVNRVGGTVEKVTDALKLAWATGSCGFPTIPLLLLSKSEGERLRDSCQGDSDTQVEMEILDDDYPRRTLRRRLCQSAALMLSGIGILYGIIQCLQVEVGAEFLAAEIVASRRGIPCACIDVNLNMFWSRLGSSVIPTPTNLLHSFTSWLAFPRIFFRVLFPPRGGIDVCGGIFLHGASFPIKTWVAFILAGFGASFVTSHILELFAYGAEQGMEQTHVVAKEDGQAAQEWIMLLVEMYIMPQVYDAVAASRDEAMYLAIVEKTKLHMARRIVVVVGAGHANGILQRARTRGL